MKEETKPVVIDLAYESLEYIHKTYAEAFGPMPPDLTANDIDWHIREIIKEAAKVRTVYAVFQEGVYRHQCGGIFTELKDAEEAALALIKAERDDWHHYEVVPVKLNTIIALGDEEICIVRYNRKDAYGVGTVTETRYDNKEE